MGHFVQLMQLPSIEFREFGDKYPQVPGKRSADYFLSTLPC